MRDLIRRRTIVEDVTLALGALALLALGGVAVVPPSDAQAQALEAPEYVVGPQDVLAVTVANEPTLSGKFTVVVDGTVVYPLLGSVKVGGLSLRAVERELATRLRDGYLEKPVVSVALDQFGSQRVLVIGEVRQAGSYPLSGPTTLLEILLKAGAPTATAGSEALVVRGRGADPRIASTSAAAAAAATSASSNVLRANLDALQRGDLSQDLPLRPGDMVFVPRAEPTTPVYVMGLVKSPGAYQVTKGATVLQVLAQAGGVTDRGSTGRIKIVRKTAQRNVEMKASLHDLVQPGDTILVNRRLF
jgi:polysaccharide biosynthesis/export protein